MGGLRKEGESTDDSVLWNRSAVYPKIFGKNYGICYKNTNHIWYALARKPNFHLNIMIEENEKYHIGYPLQDDDN